MKIGDNFFSNWETLMPGDVVSDKVLIRNDYANPTKIYFRTANVANDDLLKKLKIKITNENDVILDGALSDTVNDEVLIAELKKGEEKELSYTVTVPAELRNVYAMTDTKTQWIFRAEIEKQGSGSGGSFGSSGSKKNYAINGGTGGPGAEQETGATETTETEKTNAENSEDKGHKDSDNSGKNPITDLIDRTKDVINKHIPKMGDDNVGTVAFCFMSASAFLLLIIFVGDKKNKKKKGDKNGES